MKSELKVFTPNFKLSIVIGLFATIIIIFIGLVYRFEFGLILLAVAGVISLTGIVSVTIKILMFSDNRKLSRIEIETKRQELRLTTYKADKAEVERYVLHFSKNERIVTPVDAPIQVIEAQADTVKHLPESVEEYRNLLDIDYVHMLVQGQTDAGKTTVMNWLIDNSQASNVFVIDAHSKLTEWSKKAEIIKPEIVNKERDFNNINRFMLSVMAELEDRYTNDEIDFNSLLIVIDEWLVILDKCDAAKEFFKTIGSEGRKVKINLVLGTQSATVEDLGVSGQIRDNLMQLSLTVELRDKNLGKLHLSRNSSELVRLEGPYHQTGRFFNHQRSLLVLPDITDIEPDETEATILNLHRQGESKRSICEKIYGYVSSNKYPEIDAILSKHGEK